MGTATLFYVDMATIIQHRFINHQHFFVTYRGVGRGGSKGSDEPSFQPRIYLKIANYLSNLNTKRFQV